MIIAKIRTPRLPSPHAAHGSDISVDLNEDKSSLKLYSSKPSTLFNDNHVLKSSGLIESREDLFSNTHAEAIQHVWPILSEMLTEFPPAPERKPQEAVVKEEDATEGKLRPDSVKRENNSFAISTPVKERGRSSLEESFCNIDSYYQNMCLLNSPLLFKERFLQTGNFVRAC